MTARKPIVMGGIAALLGAGTLAALFPPLRDAGPIAREDAAGFDQARALFASYLATGEAEAHLLRSAGFEADNVPEAPGATLLVEPEGDCAGRGTYWLREAGAPIALTAPHRGSDRHTGALAAALFMETGARGAGWNSAPRRASETCANALDLAREEKHPFTAFASALAAEHPHGLVVQLHGFDGDRRESLPASEAAMILSDGTNAPSDRLLDLADCLSLAFAPREVLVYPHQTGELGALTNAQGRLLRAEGFGGFVHLEISADMRDALVADEALRDKLGECLVGASV